MKMNNKKLCKKVVGFIAAAAVTLFVGGKTASAAMDGVNYIDPDKVYDEANSLIIKKEAKVENFSANVTGSSPKKTIYSKGDSGIYKSFDKNYGSIKFTFGDYPTTGLDKNTVIKSVHENQGTYNGKKINIEQTFSDMVVRQSSQKEKAPKLEIAENVFSGYFFQGITQFTYQLKFVYADTGETVDFSTGDSFLSFNSLNGAEKPAFRFESVKYLNNSDPKIVYVTKDTNIGYEIPSEYAVEEHKEGAYNEYMYGGISNDFTDYLGGATYTKNSVQFKLTGKEQNFKIGSVEGMAWNSIFSATLFNVKIPTPTKTVEDDKGIDLDGKTVERGQVLNYKVHQKVNNLGVDILERYKSFVISDTLDKNVTYKSAIFTDGSGNEIKDAGTITHDSTNNKVTFTASKEFLEKMELNGNTYILQIKAVVKDNVKGGTIVKNVGKTTINNQNETTNEVVNPVESPKGSIEITKVTNQLTGIKVSINKNNEKNDKKVSSFSSVFGINAYAEEVNDKEDNVNISNVFQYSKKPQGGVTYELIVLNDIVDGSGKTIQKAGTSLGTKTTDAKLGLAVFSDLYEGDYVIYERKAPLGIQIDPNPIFVSVSTEGNKQEYTVKQEHEDKLQEVEIKGLKEFEQTDGTFKGQAGATFGLYLQDEYVIKSGKEDNTDTSSTTESETQTTETKESTQPEAKPLSSTESTNENSEEETNTSSTTSTTESSDDEKETSKTILKDTLIADMKVNEDGSLSYKGVLIPNQRYYVKEIETSEGYQLLPNKLTFIYQPVNNDAVADITLYAAGYVTDGVYIPYADVESLEMPTKDVLSTSEKYKEPTEDQKESIKNLIITENSIKKSIKKSDGTLVDSYDILEDKEKITFSGVVTLGNGNDPDDSIILEDNLPKGLNYESMKIFDEKKQDITSKVKIDSADQNIKVTINKEYAKTLKSTKLYWEVETIYNASGDVAGKKLENEMILHVGDKKYNSKVTLQTPEEFTKDLPRTGEMKQKIIGVVSLIVLVGLGYGWIRFNKKDLKKP